jgi:nucleoid DNA-binding protein
VSALGRPVVCYHASGMKKNDLAQRLARDTNVSKAVAADELGRVVHDIVKNLRRGVPVRLPGLGTFTPGKRPDFQFDSKPAPRTRRK